MAKDIELIRKELNTISEEDLAFAMEMESIINSAGKDEYKKIPREDIDRFKRINKSIGEVSADIQNAISQYVVKNVKSRTAASIHLRKLNINRHKVSSNDVVNNTFQKYFKILSKAFDTVVNIKGEQSFNIEVLKIELKSYHELLLKYLETNDNVSQGELVKIHSNLKELHKTLSALEQARTEDNTKLTQKMIAVLHQNLDQQFTSILRRMMFEKRNFLASEWIITHEKYNRSMRRSFEELDNNVNELKDLLEKYEEYLVSFNQELFNTLSQEPSPEMIKKATQKLADEELSQQRSNLRAVLNVYGENDYIYGLSQGRSGMLGILAPHHDNQSVIEGTSEQKIEHVMMVDDLNNMFLGTGIVKNPESHEAPGIGEKYDAKSKTKVSDIVKEFKDSLSQNREYNPKYHAGSTRQDVNYRVKQSCKHGIYFATSKQKSHIHFMLDGINMDWVVDKRGPSDYGDGISKIRDITGAELRYLFRNRDMPDIKQRVIFWHDGKQVKPPWEHNPQLWARYNIEKDPVEVASKHLDKIINSVKFDKENSKNPAVKLKCKVKLRVLNKTLSRIRVASNQEEVLNHLQLIRNEFPAEFSYILQRLENNKNLQVNDVGQSNELTLSNESIKHDIVSNIRLVQASLLQNDNSQQQEIEATKPHNDEVGDDIPALATSDKQVLRSRSNVENESPENSNANTVTLGTEHLQTTVKQKARMFEELAKKQTQVRPKGALGLYSKVREDNKNQPLEASAKTTPEADKAPSKDSGKKTF